MPALPAPTLDIRAPNGGRTVLRPLVRLERLPGLSRGGLAAVAVLSAIFLVTSVNRLNHTDLWGHLNFGRWIVTHGRLPVEDPFRSFARAEPFVNLYGLAQVLGYACHEAFGLEGLVLAHALVVTVTAALIVLATRARGVSTGWAAAAAAASYVLALPIVGTIRPQLFGMLAFSATLYGLTQLPRRPATLFWLPAVFALWANLHGSFPIGLALLGCYALGHSWSVGAALGEKTKAAPGSLLRLSAGLWSEPSVRRAWWAALLAAAAVGANPYGYDLLRFAAGFSANTNLDCISEWRPMTVYSFSGVLFFGSLVVSAVLLRRSRRPISATEILVATVFGTLALSAIRMLIWWALVWPWVVAPHAAAASRRRSEDSAVREGQTHQEPAEAVQRLLFAGLIVAGVIWWAPPTHALCSGRARQDESILSSDTPEKLAAWIQSHRIEGRIFAPMDWADYLVWRTHGAVEPLVHSHVHLIAADVWRDFLLLDQGTSDWKHVAESYGLKYLVLSSQRHRQWVILVAGDPGCRVLYQDRQALLVEIGCSPRGGKGKTR